MKLIEVRATKETINVKTNTVIYETDIISEPGILLHADASGEKDMMITNQIHNGKNVVVKMKPIRMPASKYKVGDIVAILMVNG